MGQSTSAMGNAAGGASIASMALSATGDIMKGQAQGQAAITQSQGTQAADKFQAAHLDTAAQFGRTQALLTDTSMRENLNTTLGNIEAVRAAAHADPTSPTTAALMDRSTMLSDRQRMAAVGTAKAQAEEDEASAAYLRQAGDFAIAQGNLTAKEDTDMGNIAAYTDIAKGLATMATAAA